MTKQIVILGAGYAGLLAAARLARQTRKLGTHITLINKTSEFVHRIRLHEQAVRQPKQTRRLADFLKGTGVLIVGFSATKCAFGSMPALQSSSPALASSSAGMCSGKRTSTAGAPRNRATSRS